MKKEFTIKSNKDNLSLSVFMMVPKNPVGIVQISHGMCEHKERYYDFMEFLSTNGYITIIHDQRGHGKSINNKDDLGYMYDRTSEYIVEDFHQITEYIKKEYPDLPLILFGHSMGSLIVRNILKKYPEDIDKMVICGSPSKHTFLNFAVFVDIVSTMIYRDDHHRCPILNKIVIGPYIKSVKHANTNFDWICTNQDVVEEYCNDPLTGFLFTNNAYFSLFKLLKNTYNKKDWNITNPKMPIFFIAGAEDPVIINKKEWLKSIDFLRKIGYTNIKSKLYRNSRHELINEYTNNVVYKDIIDFIDK